MSAGSERLFDSSGHFYAIQRVCVTLEYEKNRSLVPGSLFDDVLEENEPSVQCALDLLQEEEDFLIVWNTHTHTHKTRLKEET